METWFLILVSLCTCALLKSILNLLLFFTTNNNNDKLTQNLPPGPKTFPIIGDISWFRKSQTQLASSLRSLHAKLGPIVTLRIGPLPSIFVSDHFLAYQALVQNGAVFADRPPALPTRKVISSNQLQINASTYGPTWRLLRRNLTAHFLHPSRVKSYTHARKWVLQILVNRMESESRTGNHSVRVKDHFQYAMFCLLVLMCFGDKLEEDKIQEIERVERNMLLNLRRFAILNFMPRLTKILFRKKWSEFLQLRRDQEDVLIPLIKARKEAIDKKRLNTKDEEDAVAYVDTLFDLDLPEEKRKLNEKEMVSLCNEFLNGGTDTTSTAMQWIMANLVKYPEIQHKLFAEIRGIVGDNEEEEIKEGYVEKMPYLKAVILEALRRHPPGHFVAPHTVTEDVMLDKYVIPKGSRINFMVADMGRDPKVWEDPMAFKPERFLCSNGGDDQGVELDITGSREIKMMPFGAGRRVCPGHSLARFHLGYFVANLVRKYEWKAVDGEDVDLSEKDEFTVTMKDPLQALISPRAKK